jgi:hypothetical protein
VARHSLAAMMASRARASSRVDLEGAMVGVDRAACSGGWARQGQTDGEREKQCNVDSGCDHD